MSDCAEGGALLGIGDGVSGIQNDNGGMGGASYLLGKGYVARRGVGGRQRRQSAVAGMEMDRDSARGRAGGILLLIA